MLVMNESKLEYVCGGDFGDTEKDNNSNKSMYKCGQYVEVYVNFYPIRTNRSLILNKIFESGRWQYFIQYHVGT